jgi:hypothetical protein
MILRSIFTIRVCFVFSMPCQNRDFNNLEDDKDRDMTKQKKGCHVEGKSLPLHMSTLIHTIKSSHGASQAKTLRYLS